MYISVLDVVCDFIVISTVGEDMIYRDGSNMVKEHRIGEQGYREMYDNVGFFWRH